MSALAVGSGDSQATIDQTDTTYRVLSFGAGVQTIYLLYSWLFTSIIMPREEPSWRDYEGFFGGKEPDLVVFADTQCEPADVYEAVEDARRLCEWADIPFEIVTKGNLARPALASTGTQGIYVPVYTLKLATDADGPAGTKGQLFRQCTSAFKIDPIVQLAKERAGGRPIQIHLGISVDEAHRMKRRDIKDQLQYAYPLVFDSRLGYTSRNDCVNELRHLEVKASKSACVFCPYRRNGWWAKMFREAPDDFAQAVDYDRCVRDKRPGYLCFVHDSLRPLEDVVPELVAMQDAQTTLFPVELDLSGSGGCEEGFCAT